MGTGETVILIPTQVLGTGQLVFADINGGLSGWDLGNGWALSGRRIVAILGHQQSSDVIGLDNPRSLNIDWGQKGVSFYMQDGHIYGRFPLVDVVSGTPRSEVLLPKVKIWGTEATAAPLKITVRTVNNDGPTPVPYERDLIYSPNAGGWILNQPAGNFQLEIVFDILDFGNGGKG